MCLILKYNYNANNFSCFSVQNIWSQFFLFVFEVKPDLDMFLWDCRAWAENGLPHAHAVCVSELYVITVAMHRTAEVCNQILNAVSAPVVSGTPPVQRSTVENHRVQIRQNVLFAFDIKCTEAKLTILLSFTHHRSCHVTFYFLTFVFQKRKYVV